MYPCKSVKTPNLLRTKISHRTGDTKLLPNIIAPPPRPPRVSVPVGASGCTHRFGRLKINCVHYQATGKMYFQSVKGNSCPAAHMCESAARRPSHAGAGDAPRRLFPKTMKFGGCSPPHLTWDMGHGVGGLRITKCYPSVGHSVSRRCASGFCFLVLVQYGRPWGTATALRRLWVRPGVGLFPLWQEAPWPF